MPSDRKLLTLREQAVTWWSKQPHQPFVIDDVIAAYSAGWHARGRAERVTKAEQAVVEAAVRYVRDVRDGNPKQSLNPLGMAVVALERAKGRK